MLLMLQRLYVGDATNTRVTHQLLHWVGENPIGAINPNELFIRPLPDSP